MDEDLEEETKEECEKYGKVVKCVIFEVRPKMKMIDRIHRSSRCTHKDPLCFQIAEVSDDEAVRIFLEFERVESAIKGQYSSSESLWVRRHIVILSTPLWLIR